MFPYVVTDEMRSWGTFFSDLLVFNVVSAMETRHADGVDVVVVQDWLSAMAGLSLAGQDGRPLVFHVHSTEWGRQEGRGSPAVQHFEGALAYEADAIITVSEAMKVDLITHGWDGSKIEAVWNGVDPDRYRPGAAVPGEVQAVRDRYGIDAGETMLLFVGRMTQVKGVMALVEAMPAVLARHPRVKLVILGRGELEAPVRDKIDDLGIAGHVALRYEFITERERIAHYDACDLAVFPSTYEPFGIVSLEAMAMAKPVVAGAQGVVGFREQVVPAGEGQTGLHVNGADAADIAWGLNEALRDADRLREWGARGRRRVLEHFTWAQAAAKTEAVYEDAVRRFRART
jgi:glycosyltransferase involved in cell wall biosynthesis